MEGLGFVIIIALGIGIYFLRVASHKGSIENKIEELNGVYISHEKRFFLSGIGPFHIVGKGQVVYSFKYELDGCVNEGWVRFGSILGPNWQLDYIED